MNMLNRWVIAVFVSLCVMSIASTSKAQFGTEFGIVGGENFANAQTLPTPFPNSTAQGRSGYIIGIRNVTTLIGPIGIQSEVLLAQRKFADTHTFESTQQTVTWAENIEYVECPILLRIAPINRTFKLYGFIGPNIGFKLKSESITDTAGLSQSLDKSQIFNNVDLGLDVGAGIGLQIFPILALYVDGRYTYGLTDTYNHFANSSEGDLKARDFKWMAAIMLGF
jgi:hypothetical protein